jgi:hypothetical protein
MRQANVPFQVALLAVFSVALLACSEDTGKPAEGPPGATPDGGSAATALCGELSSGYWSGLAVTRDGSMLALQFASGRIDLHRGSDGARLRTLPIEGGYSMEFVAGGERLVTLGLDGTRVWKTSDGSLARDFGGGRYRVSPRGDVFLDEVSGRLLRLEDGGVVWENAELRTGLARFSGNGDYLVAAGATLKMWEVATGQERASFAHPHDPSDDAGGPAVSDDGRWMAMAYEKATVLWRVADGNRWETSGWEDGELSFSPSGSYLVFTDEGFQLWPLTPDGPGTLRTMSGIDTIMLAGDDRLVTLSHTSRLSMQPLEGPVTWTIDPGRGHHGGVSAVAASRDGRRLLSAGWDELLVWGGAGEGPTRIDNVQQSAAALSPDGTTIVTGKLSGTSSPGSASLTIRDAGTGAVRAERTLDDGARSLSLGRLSFSPDGTRLLVSTRRVTDDAVPGPGVPPSRWETRVYDTSDWRPLLTVSDLEGPAALSPDRSTLATATVGAIRRHDASSGATLGETPHLCPAGRSRTGCEGVELAYSPDGRWLVASTLGRVSVLDETTRSIARTFPTEGPVAYVRRLAISPDSRRLAIQDFAVVSLADGAVLRSFAPPRGSQILGSSAFTFLENRPAMLVADWSGRVRIDCD